MVPTSQNLKAEEEAAIYEPVAVADCSGAVHVFWQSRENLLYYMRIDQTGWSAPVDVLASGMTPSRRPAQATR